MLEVLDDERTSTSAVFKDLDAYPQLSDRIPVTHTQL